MSMPRYRSTPPSRSGSAISVSTATTPSSPGLNSFIAADCRRPGSGGANRVLPPLRADVVSGRPNDLVVRMLLEHVRRLADDAAALEERREQVVGDVQVAVDGARVEVHVRPETLLLVG